MKKKVRLWSEGLARDFCRGYSICRDFTESYLYRKRHFEEAAQPDMVFAKYSNATLFFNCVKEVQSAVQRIEETHFERLGMRAYQLFNNGLYNEAWVEARTKRNPIERIG